MLGCCDREPLCDRCLQDAQGHLQGVAACRGDHWARCVAQRVRFRTPWPSYDGRCAEIARRKVADIARDPRLREILARVVHHYAERRWTCELQVRAPRRQRVR